MPGGMADVLEVVVLAACTHALLRGGSALIGPLLQSGEDVLELDHAGIGEQQCRIVARDERARRDDLVPVAREILEERGADVVGGLHGQILALSSRHTRGNAGLSPTAGDCVHLCLSSRQRPGPIADMGTGLRRWDANAAAPLQREGLQCRCRAGHQGPQ